jgi:hypothetical protein
MCRFYSAIPTRETVRQQEKCRSLSPAPYYSVHEINRRFGNFPLLQHDYPAENPSRASQFPGLRNWDQVYHSKIRVGEDSSREVI